MTRCQCLRKAERDSEGEFMRDNFLVKIGFTKMTPEMLKLQTDPIPRPLIMSISINYGTAMQ